MCYSASKPLTMSSQRGELTLNTSQCAGLWNYVTSWWRDKMETFQRYWPFVRGIHRSPVNSPHRGQWRGALMFSFIWINGWVNNRHAGDFIRPHAHNDVIVCCLHDEWWWDLCTGRELRSGVKCIVVTIVTGSLWLVRRYRWGQVNLKTFSTIPSH